jgi:uncharacterized membrane protein
MADRAGALPDPRAATPPATAPASPSRLASIDVLRGAAMVLMAIDHVRVYSGVQAGGPSPAVFFTRWVTHFCAPAFVFLAGTSAFLYGRRHPHLSRFLLTRGLWLILLELTVLRLFWTFNFDFAHYELAGVIWVLGWSMIVLAALSKLPAGVVGAIGVAVIGLHNLLDTTAGALSESLGGGARAALWKIFYIGFFAGPIEGPGGSPSLTVLYSLIPWIGVMAAGYAFGAIVAMDPARKGRLCLTIGLLLLLRGFNLYGDPRPWSAPPPHVAEAAQEGRPSMPALLSFLNTTKYPASLAFLLMTIGPMLALIPLAERLRGPLARALTTFGRVPLFFYLLHIPLIHALALVVSKIRRGHVDPWLFANHPMGNPRPPEGYTWSLPLLYLVWAVAIVLLFAACRWYAAVKARRRDWWLSYL